jgi:VCBS repeat-containing protein
VSDAYPVNTGAALNVPAANGLLANDTDADTSTTQLQAQVVTGPTRGRLELRLDGSFTYAPTGSAGGTDTFTYRVVDPQGNAATGTATITITAVACGPRPTVSVQTSVVGGALQATVTATETGTPTQNRLQSITFGTLQNAVVTLNGETIANGQTVTLPAGSMAQSFTVRRVEAGRPATVPLTVTDQCGSWPTFVGGGAGAAF